MYGRKGTQRAQKIGNWNRSAALMVLFEFLLVNDLDSTAEDGAEAFAHKDAGAGQGDR